jgi:ATP-dependent Clp protease, protease subunit
MSKRDLPIIPDVLAARASSVIAPKAKTLWNSAIRATAEDQDATISVLGLIGGDVWDDGVSARRISAALRSIGSRDVTVNINSPGGNFMEGVAIYNALRQHPHHVTVRVLGIAASAASIVAMAGDRIEIAKAGFLMIHNTHVDLYGDRNAHREVADTLETFDRTLATLYADRTDLDADAIAAMMDAETYFDGSAAIEQGFADELLPVDVISRDEDAKASALRRIDNALAEQGWSRSDRRAAFKELADTPSAARNAMPSAGATAADDGSASLSIALARLKLARA